MKTFFRLSPALALNIFVSGCGTTVPLKDPIHPNDINQQGLSREGLVQANVVSNIRCEIQNAIYAADQLGSMPYLGKTWGSQVTLKMIWDESSGAAPGVSFITPMSAMQSFALGLGGSASAHATRLQTITFLFENYQLLADAKTNHNLGFQPDCSKLETGMMIESDLRIGEFIYDQASTAATKVQTTEVFTKPQLSTFQEDLTFVGSFGGSITPTWKLTRISADTSGSLLSAGRTTTGDVLITIGPLAKDSKGHLLPKLDGEGASQHQAGVIGGSVASQINSQGH